MIILRFKLQISTNWLIVSMQKVANIDINTSQSILKLQLKTAFEDTLHTFVGTRLCMKIKEEIKVNEMVQLQFSFKRRPNKSRKSSSMFKEAEESNQFETVSTFVWKG